MKKHVVECVWTGYRGQLVPCHCVVIRYKREIQALSKIHTIGFTDNTSMSVTMRPKKPREKVREIHGYDRLLDKCVHAGLTGFVHVNQIPD